jgi:hypothetical protein
VRPAAAALAAAVLAAGCGSEAAAAPRDCGGYKVAHDPPSAVERNQNACLLDALAAEEAATLEVTRATIEGDPLTTTYTVRDGGRIELVVDTTRDRYGPQAVTRLACTGLRETNGLLEDSGCRQAS